MNYLALLLCCVYRGLKEKDNQKDGIADDVSKQWHKA